MSMKVGSLVTPKHNFDEAKSNWPMLNYPNKGDILTVSTMKRHPKCNGFMLTFEEAHYAVDGLYHKNFLEVQPPMDLTKLLTESLTQTELNVEIL